MMTRMKKLEAENSRLKKMYAEERLKADILKEALEKKWWHRLISEGLRERRWMKGIFQFDCPASCFKSAKPVIGMSVVWMMKTAWLLTGCWATQNQRNWEFGLCFLYLRNVKGFCWNHKRVYRIYRELELNMRIKPKKRLVRENNVCGNQSMLVHGFHAWSVVRWLQFSAVQCTGWFQPRGTCHRGGFSPVGRTRGASLIEWRGKPQRIRRNNGPEYISKILETWAHENQIQLAFISLEVRNKMLLWHATTVPSGKTGYAIICLKVLLKSRWRHNDFDRTIMNAQILLSEVFLQGKKWHSLTDLYF